VVLNLFYLAAHLALKKFRGTLKIWNIFQITCKTLKLKVAVTVFTVFLNFVKKNRESYEENVLTVHLEEARGTPVENHSAC